MFCCTYLPHHLQHLVLIGYLNTLFAHLTIFRRGIAPPQRIKSVSMATFTATEVQLVEQRGNEVRILSLMVFQPVCLFACSLSVFYLLLMSMCFM